ncbi:MAG: hypothetical protein HOH43_18835 [Candidatus Latescibacteria bacterium]|jgi:hypothetical protein|nr:hypothetical protein [Candidatus Latescibacterota bacterium]
MQSICVPIPDMASEQTVEVEVKINGKTRHFNYRIESYDCHDDRTADDRIDGLRRFIASYDKTWQLMEIGTPTSTMIPIMFRQRH